MISADGDPYRLYKGIWVPKGEPGYRYEDGFGLYLTTRTARQLHSEAPESVFPRQTWMSLYADIPYQFSSFMQVFAPTRETTGGEEGQHALPALPEPAEELTPKGIKEYLDRHVIGQETAKEVLSVTTYEHMKKASCRSDYGCTPVLMIGPTGSGKTQLISSLASVIEAPYEMVKCSSLVQQGIVGEKLEDKLLSLADKVANSEGTAAGVDGILYLDEFDKICGAHGNVYSEGIMDRIIALMDGGREKLTQDDGPFQKKETHLDMDNVLFVAAGAFDGIENYGSTGRPIGFGPSQETAKHPEQVAEKQLLEYGMKRELAGRFSRRTCLHPLGEEELYRILTEAEDSPLTRTTSFYHEAENISFEFTQGALQSMAARAQTQGTGGRALDSVIEQVLHPYKMRIEEYRGQSVRIERSEVERVLR